MQLMKGLVFTVFCVATPPLHVSRIDTVVVCLQASNEGCLSKAELLSDMHFKDLRTQKSLLGVDVVGPRVSLCVCM